MDKFLRNISIFAGIILIIAAIAIVVTLSGNSGSKNVENSNQNVDSTTTIIGDVQQVKLKVSGGQYVLTPSTLQKDVPVRMEVDLLTTKGCARSVVIPEFGVRKYVETGDNIIEFTPTKTGVITIACSMNMYRGTFTVI